MGGGRGIVKVKQLIDSADIFLSNLTTRHSINAARSTAGLFEIF
jgi:hypothetical protein